jgi:hypothetical protein
MAPFRPTQDSRGPIGRHESIAVPFRRLSWFPRYNMGAFNIGAKIDLLSLALHFGGG